MLRFTIIKKLVHQFRYRLLLTYVLFGIEMSGSLLRPYFLGLAINDIIKGNYNGLIWLCGIHLLYVVAGTLRHMYDTRTYSAIYTSLVTNIIARKRNHHEVSKLSAHSTLAREFVDFLEFDLVYVVEAAFNIIGSLVLLFFYDAHVVWLCMSLLIPVTIISYLYGKRMKRLNKMKNDELEKQIDVINNGDRSALFRHYNKLRSWQVRISDQEAWSFGFMEMMVLIVVAASLLITKNIGDKALLAGSVVAIYNYILKFASGLDTIPYTIQRLTSITDISQRIDFKEKDETEERPLQKVASVNIINKEQAPAKLSA